MNRLSGWRCPWALPAALMMHAVAPVFAETSPLRDAFDEHGAGALGALHSLAAHARLIDTWAGQSRRPDPPWDRASGSQRHVIDFDAGRYAQYAHWVAAGNYPFRSLIVSDGERSFVANLDDGYWRSVDADFGSRTLDFRLSLVPLVLRNVTGDPGGDADDRRQDGSRRLLSLPATLGEQAVTLRIDRRSRRLVGLERTLADGEIQRIEYDEFERIDGILFNRVARIHYRDALVREVRFHSLTPDAALAGRFTRPPELEEHVAAAGPAVRAFGARQLAEGVWFIGEGVHYQLFVEFEDYIVALGSVAGVERRLGELARRIPGKPLRYAMVSHHHSDHLEGVRALAQAGAVLLTAPTHEDIVRRELAGLSADVESVAQARLFSDRRQRLKILQIGPNSHAEEMLAGYLPGERILFTADLFVQPPERPIRGRIPPIRDLAIAIAGFGLDAKTLLDPHSPRINAMSDLETALSR